ncbi:hypothetical protein FACS1894184_16310 [Clostridia bacterium]|nr:hypothetical protein FACS1894184_16310 [Clostridia bacterium]
MPINPMSYNTYSFSELSFVLAHPVVGQMQCMGESIGSVSVPRANDYSAHLVAHDGSVMTTKIVTRNGSLSFTVHQDCRLNYWLWDAFNHLEQAYADPEWAEWSGRIENQTTHEVTTFSNASIQKPPDISYQQQGQDVTWTFLCGIVNTEHY